MLPDKSLREVELTQTEWLLLHAKATTRENAGIRRLNKHPLNQAALERLTAFGGGPMQAGRLASMHTLTLAQHVLAAEEVPTWKTPWGITADYSRNFASMRKALSILAQQLTPEEIAGASPEEAGHLILEALCAE
ncbi:MAG TPA: hypothetical protein P5567_00345 [Kiritimatiellia bacterium]|nr:hypothetical protein [Kiritimatiellia bacterium]HRZ10883.1 hypothetical protein [Kiritimatiellia bacterium]HSA18844.1 hypothetical protein [Kiritimatiellia bacterium]